MSERTRITSGAEWEDVVGYSRAVRVGNDVYVSGTTSLDEQGRVHGEVFSKVRPASTMVEVQRLIDPRMLLEIEAHARIG